MTKGKLPPKTLICMLRVSPAFYKAVKEAVRQNGDPTVMVWQGQARSYPDGTPNPSLFLQDHFNDHAGKPLSPTEKIKITQRLRDPSYTLHIVNSCAGDHANDRYAAGAFALMEADIEYRARGGIRTIVYDLLYDGNGRNDKKHIVEHTDENGQAHKVAEGNIPTGKYAPLLYRRNGADRMTVFDPHSKEHRDNLKRAFGSAATSFHSTLRPIAQHIIARHKDALLTGRFRLGAPDGWDKKDDPAHNEAIIRTRKVAAMIWDALPALHKRYDDQGHFYNDISFGIIKKREAAYEGAPAKARFKQLVGNVRHCDCVLLDDLADSGNSLIQSATALRDAGAGAVDAAICHGPASRASMDLILHQAYQKENGSRPVIDHLIVTNTMPRVEHFYQRLKKSDRKRTSLINCASEYIARLCRPGQKPSRPQKKPGEPKR